MLRCSLACFLTPLLALAFAAGNARATEKDSTSGLAPPPTLNDTLDLSLADAISRGSRTTCRSRWTGTIR